MKSLSAIAIMAVSIAFFGCKSSKDAASQEQFAPVTYETKDTNPHSSQPAAALPKAVVYQTNGDYNNNVSINVGPGNKIISYPAPTDVSAASSPIAVGDGWLLDRRGGVGANTVFLKYTYSEYSQLPAAPSPDQLLEAIIPGAKVTRIKILPITANEAIADPSLVSKYLE